MLALRRRISRSIMALGELVFAGSWLLIGAVLVLDLVGILHRGAGFRVQAAGLLVMNTALAVNMLAHLHSHHGIFPVLFAGFALFMGGVVISSREHRTARHDASPELLLPRRPAPLDRQ
jgi:hypothetical protein